jgi:hypothetical protein
MFTGPRNPSLFPVLIVPPSTNSDISLWEQRPQLYVVDSQEIHTRKALFHTVRASFLLSDCVTRTSKASKRPFSDPGPDSDTESETEQVQRWWLVSRRPDKVALPERHQTQARAASSRLRARWFRPSTRNLRRLRHDSTFKDGWSHSIDSLTRSRLQSQIYFNRDLERIFITSNLAIFVRGSFLQS